jgi:ABC-2 type transport system permease protein
MTWAIETFEITKRFPQNRGWGKLFSRELGKPVVNNVILRVREGELFGLVGPNGAGKTTLIKMLTTLIMPTVGSAVVNGYSLDQATKIKGSLGLVTSDERSFYWRLSGRQNLEFFASLHGMTNEALRVRVEEVLRLVDLEDVADQVFQFYSTGIRQRLSIARALLNKPRLLFLDEPTKGLDPLATHQLHDLISNTLTQQQGITVFMTSHRLEEVERLCDRVAIMYQGQIKACGSVPELSSLIERNESYQLEISGWNSDLQDNLGSIVNDLTSTHLSKTEYLVKFNAPKDRYLIDRVFDVLRVEGVRIQSVSRELATLENVFRQLTEYGGEKENLISQSFSTENEIISDNKCSQDKTSNSRDEQYTSGKSATFLRAAKAFLKRDLQSEMSYRVSFILQFVNVFFSVAMFYFIAEMFGEAASPYLESYGGDYFSFVLIGIAFSGYFGVGLSGFSNSLRQAQTTGTLEAMLSTPTHLSTVIICSSLWSYLITTFRVIIYLLVGGVILHVNLGNGNYPAAILILILTVVSFSSLGIVAASFIMVLKRGNPITWVFGAVSNLIGGIYYPIAVLPGWMQLIAALFPITYALRSMRLALLQSATFNDLLSDLGILSLFCIVLLPFSLLTFRYAVNRARMDGSLTHY